MINDRLAKEQKMQKHLNNSNRGMTSSNNNNQTAAKASFLGAILNGGQVSATQNKWAPKSTRNIITD